MVARADDVDGNLELGFYVFAEAELRQLIEASSIWDVKSITCDKHSDMYARYSVRLLLQVDGSGSHMRVSRFHCAHVMCRMQHLVDGSACLRLQTIRQQNTRACTTIQPRRFAAQ
jgi:hypothetical protein